MKKIFFLATILVSWYMPVCAEQVKTIGNPWTGKPDYITALTSGTIPAGATNYIWNTSTLQEPSTFYVDAGYVQNLLELNFLTQGSIMFAGASGVVSQDNSYLFYDATNHYFGLGLNSPTSLLHTVGIKPADNGSAGGTNAGVNILLRGAIGGDTTINTTGTGGAGGQIQMFGGVGGTAPSASTVSSGGAGGGVIIQAGSGGVPNGTGGIENGGAGGGFVMSGGNGARPLGSATTKTGGAGGSFTMNGGSGGIGSSGDGGAGGGFFLTSGPGGATSTSGVGGDSGAFTLFGGVGGAGVTGGNAGAYTFTGNRGGTGTTGNGGNGSAMTFTAGNGGSSSSGGNAGTAGDINLKAGNGSTGATNSNGGNVYISQGSGVSPATTGYIYLGADNNGAIRGNVVAGSILNPSSATFTVYASSADTIPLVIVSTQNQTADMTDWRVLTSTTGKVNSTGDLVFSSGTFSNEVHALSYYSVKPNDLAFYSYVNGGGSPGFANVFNYTANPVSTDFYDLVRSPRLRWTQAGLSTNYITSGSLGVSGSNQGFTLATGNSSTDQGVTIGDGNSTPTRMYIYANTSANDGSITWSSANGNWTIAQPLVIVDSVTVSTAVVRRIVWSDGTIQVSSPPASGAGVGDNLGNHLATTTLSMQGFSLTNIGTSSSVFGTNGNLTVNSSATFVSTVTFNGVSTTTYSAGTALDMTAATLVLPTAASPPTNAVGQFGLDTTDSVIVGSTGTTTPLVFGDPMVQFTATISTDSTSVWQGRNVPIWQNKSNMDVAIDTITATTYSAAASTLAFQLQSRPYNALNSNGTNIFTSTQPATWTGWTTTSFSSATIRANNYLVFFATTTTPDTGTVNSIIVSVRGRKIAR